MSADDRIDGLERRIASLETLVRELARGELRRAEPKPREAPREAAMRDPRSAAPRPAAPTPPNRPLLSGLSTPKTRHVQDAEQWIGQRGLLAVGVVLLILAAAYMLKLAFERGWISPAMRCAGGAVAGAVVAYIGWRQYGKGLRTYGAALIGTGAAIVYLALWAAARLYALVPSGLGIAGLAFVSLFLAVIAYRLDIEALGAAAALGTLFAPIVIGSEQPNFDVLLTYLAVTGLTLGAVAVHRGWRLTTGLVALSYFGLGLGAAEGANAWATLLFGVVGGVAGFTVGLRYGWLETRFLAFSGAWGMIALAGGLQPYWPVTAAAVILAVPIWLHGLRSPRVWPNPDIAVVEGHWSFGESLYFYLTPLFVCLTVSGLAPGWFRLHEGAPWLFIGLAYLVAAYRGVRIPFALAGATLFALAAMTEWPDLRATWTLLVLSVTWAILDHVLERTDGRWYALGTLLAALIHLLSFDLAEREAGGPGFRDAWALTLWGSILGASLFAAGLLRRPGSYAGSDAAGVPATKGKSNATQEFLELDRQFSPLLAVALWSLAGILLFGGVTGELMRLVAEWDFPRATERLASGLSVSAWWALFAGALVMFGFSRNLRRVRIAGLMVAGLAVIKVVFFDLASLDALYRVGSVFILGVVSLIVAYLYHIHARRAAADQAITNAPPGETAQG